MKRLIGIFSIFWLSILNSAAQVNVTIYPDSLTNLVNPNFQPGVFYVPKTEDAQTDFLTNDIYQNSIRTHILESVINNASNLAEAAELLEGIETILVDLSAKCDKFIFIFEKMPAWLSSSSDGSPAATPGWFVLNTKKPENWEAWKEMVTTLTEVIVNDFGIGNAYFEVWNEPDIGSWTDSVADYLELYKHTYDGIKSVDEALPVGGPATNFWANNIYWKPIPGFIPPTSADSSLITTVLEYGIANSRVPDFISWHNFNISYQEYEHGAAYVNQKCEDLGIPSIPIILSEWNAPSQVRDSQLAVSYMIKSQIEIAQTNIENNVIAAWQDFSFETEEFHNDYGLITYNAIHKPAYNAIKLTNQLQGANCKILADQPFVLTASAFEDSLYIVIANYCPPPIQEAINYTLFEGQFNAYDLDNAGYIDLDAGDFSYLASIYAGEVTIPSDTPLNIAINDAISIYAFYESILTTPRTFNLTTADYAGTYNGFLCEVDTVKNNMQHMYDSLLIEGFTQTDAAAFIQINQELQYSNFQITAGVASLTMAPNAVALIKVGIDGVGDLSKNTLLPSFILFPNPTTSFFTIGTNQLNENYSIYNAQGECVKQFKLASYQKQIDICLLETGIYIVRNNSTGYCQRLVKL